MTVRLLRLVIRSVACWLSAAVLITACGMSADDHEADMPQGVSSMIDVRVVLPRDTYLAGENIEALVEFENSGKNKVEFPEPGMDYPVVPLIELAGPGYSEERVLNAPEEPDQNAGSAAMVTVAPGETYRYPVNLSELSDFREYGEYRVRARVDWKNIKAESEPVTFRVQSLAIRGVDAEYGVRPTGVAEGHVAIIAGGDAPTDLYVAAYYEGAPGISEADCGRLRHWYGVGAEATDVTVPKPDGPFFEHLPQWVVWREGNRVLAISSADDEPISCELKSGVANLIQPALIFGDGPIEVLVLSDSRQEISLVRFPVQVEDREEPEDTEDDGVVSGEVVWTTKLPFEATLATTYPGTDGKRHVIFATQHEAGFQIFHAQYTASAKPKEFKSVKLDAGTLVLSSQPTVYIDAAGNVAVSVLTVSSPESLYCEVVEAVFARDGSPKPFDGRLAVGYLHEMPKMAAVMYHEGSDGNVRCDVVLEQPERGVLKLNAVGELQPVDVQGRSLDPMQLTPGVTATYIIYSDPQRGLYLEAI